MTVIEQGLRVVWQVVAAPGDPSRRRSAATCRAGSW